jgi:hypothetical protein
MKKVNIMTPGGLGGKLHEQRADSRDQTADSKRLIKYMRKQAVHGIRRATFSGEHTRTANSRQQIA